MRIRKLLTTLVLTVGLVVPVAPAAEALPARAAAAPAGFTAPSQFDAAHLTSQTTPPTPAPDDAPPTSGEETENAQVPQEIADVPGVTEDWWAQVQSWLRSDLYAITAGQTEGEALTYRGYNPDQRFDFTATAGGLRLSQAAADQESPPDPGWVLGLRATGYGAQGNVYPPPAIAETTSDDNRLEFRRTGLTEWYINDECGLEQGFTVDAHPVGGGDLLVVEMALETGLIPTLVGNQAIEFTQPGGNVVVLRYSDLSAYDAAGRTLPAHMALSGCERDARPGNCTLTLVIEAAGALYPLTIDPLISTPTWTATGENASDEFGYSVATAGDVNGDGYADLVVGARRYANYRGKAYVYYGSAAGLGITPAWTAMGENTNSYFGSSVATAGDVNNDGYDDLVVGAPVDNYWRGKVYVYYGSATGLGATHDWFATGEAGDRYDFGFSVATAGDVNGDGYDDLVTGAPKYNNYRGQVCVFYGAVGGLHSIPDWCANGGYLGYDFGFSVAAAGDVNGDGYDDLVAGAPKYDNYRGQVCVFYGAAGGPSAYPGWCANGGAVGYSFGFSVATAGDVNGDGYDDLVAGAPGANGGRGQVCVFYGAAGGPSAYPGWAAAGEKANDEFGHSVATAGDLNHDGYADLVVGASRYDTWRGKAYVYHGSPAGLGAAPAWTASGENVHNYFGHSVAAAGDVNGDGYADLVISAFGYASNRGKAYLYHGTPWGLNPPHDWTAGGEQADDQFGYVVSAAGDVNGDGFSDLAVGAPGHDGGRGRVYLFPGTPAGLGAIPWTAAGENVGDQFAKSVAAAGDVNGDGYDDLVVGAPDNGDNGAGAGKAYIFYGSAEGPGSPPGWMATGVNRHDRFGASVATAGDVNGDGYADLVVGATGYPGGNGYGQVYVYHGSAAGLGAAPVWTANGEHTADGFGYAVGTAGDINGDGCADLVAGAWGYDGYKGKVYVYHGCSPLGLGAAAVWTAKGVKAGDYFGWSVGTAGDVNGDGYADLVVGAYGANSGRGQVYLYHGSPAGLGDAGWTDAGEKENDAFGFAVATAGDMDGDGYADLVVGAPGYNTDTGRAYRYHGGVDGLSIAPVRVAFGAQPGDHFGAAVGTAGDVNGDGLTDLAVGAWGYDNPATLDAGRVYVYHGAVPGLSNEWTAAGENTSDKFGYSVATAGDVNGDGYTDVVVSSSGYGGDRGKVYVYHGSPSGLEAAPAWIAMGENGNDKFGHSVATAGDVNNDGYADLAIGAYQYDSSRGKVYVYHGSASGLPPTPSWGTTGGDVSYAFGFSVATAGDVNGDSYDDLVAGAPRYNGYQGQVCVFYGAAVGLPSIPNWCANGGALSYEFGFSVATAGDVNGDGFADLVAGAPAFNSRRGQVCVFYGAAGGPSAYPSWCANGGANGDEFGASVATAGDVNKNGYADLVAGAPGSNNSRGQACVFYGSAAGLSAYPDWAATGRNTNDRLGTSVATAGDVNRDGYADLVIGAPRVNSDRGQAYVYHGSAGGLGATPAFTATGGNAGDQFGSSVATVGDVDGDGFADLAVGAYGYDGNRGIGRVFYGSPSGLSVLWTAMGKDAGDHFGFSVATAGDVNGDGYEDVVVGAYDYATAQGRVYVYHGSTTGLGATPAFTATGQGGGDHFGYSVATAGDVNGDGYADLVVGAYGYTTRKGKVYVYHGSPAGLEATPAWTAVGEKADNYFGHSVAMAGDVNGDSYTDLVVGAYGSITGTGKVYVYHGSPAGLGAKPIFTATGKAVGDEFGFSVATAGDVNGDGFADLVIGAPGYGGTGRVYLCTGSPAGLGGCAWAISGESPLDRFGASVATAGDVNGDGYTDVAVGANGYLTSTGKVYIYHGSALGLDAPYAVFSGENVGDRFGASAATAGDVNGDGYADLVVGAYGYNGNRGKVYVYAGSPAGLSAASWLALGENTGDGFGRAVASAGDVNGDGFADLVVGANGYLASTGKVYIYQGNDGGGRPALARQVRGDVSGKPVQPWGPSYTADSFGVWLQAVHPLGSGRARLQVQVCPPGKPFDDALCLNQVSGKWTAVSGASGVVLKETVHGLAEGTLYHWRARVLYDSPLYSRGPWRRLTAQALEGDVRSTRLPADLAVTKVMTPLESVGSGQVITYILTFHSSGPARGVVMTDILPSDITVVQIRSSGAAITDTGYRPCCVWRAQDLEAGQGGVITITGLAQVDRYVNTVVITSTSPEPNPANNTATVQTHVPGILYVDGDARGANNGQSWASAYTDLQNALDEAKAGDQIWIASGTYRPTGGGLRTASFHLTGSVALHGGFAGAERWLYERDGTAPPTILSGDIGTAGASADNVYHVVTAGPGVTETAVLEGVIIAGGNANGTGANGLGGGLYSPGGSPTLVTVTFAGNSADQGGGIYLQKSHAVLVNVALSGNEAEAEGGGLYNAGSSPALVNVTFSGNSAYAGGGLYNAGSRPAMVNVIFSGNEAEAEGGGLYNTAGSAVTLTNVTFSGNSAVSGGGLYNTTGSVVTLTNVTFSGNSAVSGGGLYNTTGSAATLINNIVWGNTPDQIATDGGGVNVRYSDVEGDYAGPGNLAADPQFVDADGPDDITGTLDDDLRLYTTFRHPSPVIDAGNNTALPPDTADLDGDGIVAEPLPLDLSGRERLIGFKSIAPTVDMGAYEATLLDVLAAGDGLFDEGEAFRLENLQLLSSDTLTQAVQNYANFNDGEWYYAFCADYAQIDADGYCPDTTPPQGIRNKLLDAVDLYRVALKWPTEVFTPLHGLPIAARDAGGRGVMSATTEIANVHLIFGNEFLVDATDYRFSTGGISYADQIIAQELDELVQAEQQFSLILDLMFVAFNDWKVAGYCGSDEFEQIGMASSLMMSALNEAAARHYMLRDSEAALEVYNRAYTNQYLHLMALAELAAELGEEYLQNGSYEMLNNLSQMRGRAQAIHDGLDFFGFAPTYAPLQSYETLLFLEEGYGAEGLLGTARDLEDQAREAQRTFDENAAAMAAELEGEEHNTFLQLHELCGDSDDAYATCQGGLMLQNLDALDAASIRAGLAWLRAQNLAEQVRIEEERAGQVISVILGRGNTLSAYALAMGKLRADRTTTTYVETSEDIQHVGVEVQAGAYFQYGWKLPGAMFGTPAAENQWGFKAEVMGQYGYQHQWTFVRGSERTWDPTEAQIASFESLQALREAEAEADIEGANSAAAVRNLLLQQSEALKEFDIAVAEFNTLADEHNYLAQRYSLLLNIRAEATSVVALHNVNLLNPAYRIWRDSLTIQSARALGLAAQFAYLTARAAEYELLTPYPNLGDIFRARTANDIRLFLDDLKVWTQALDLPGQLNRYPYTLSLACDVWGLTDESLRTKYPGLTKAKLSQKRFELFQELLQSNVYTSGLRISFATTLDQQRVAGQYLFSPNIWNNRIAGIGAPLAENEGVRLNIVTRQSGSIAGVEVVLIHGAAEGGTEVYRNVANETVRYDPDTAVPVGYVLPAGLAPENTTVVLRPGINGAGGIANSGLINLSVASSVWTLRIPTDSQGNLRYKDIEDIEIVLDTTGRALPGRAAQATQDALRLQAGLEMAPVEIERAPEPILSAPISNQTARAVTAPIISGEIGGPYSGMVMVTKPVTIALQVLDVELWNAGGVLTGAIAADQGALYPANVGLHGMVAGDSFTLTSDVFTNTVAGRTVTQTLALAGTIEEEGDSLRAVYTGTITHLLPEPIVVYGKYHASRPAAIGSERLIVKAGAWSVQPDASTTLTATLYDAAMQIITATQTLTFTADLGTVTPQVIQTVNGEASVIFTAGITQGQAIVLATTGEITGSVRIQISDMAPPQVDFTATPLTGGTPLTVTFTDLSQGQPNAWLWDFGDGASSAEQYPTHIYTATGVYTVTLTASNALDADTHAKPGFVVVGPAVPERRRVYLPVVLRNSP